MENAKGPEAEKAFGVKPLTLGEGPREVTLASPVMGLTVCLQCYERLSGGFQQGVVGSDLHLQFENSTVKRGLW